MNEIYPIAKLGDLILIINKDDLPYVGKDNALEIKCVKVDLKHGLIDSVMELEKHLKFNPWEELSETERDHAICVASFCFAAPRLPFSTPTSEVGLRSAMAWLDQQ